MVEDYLEAGAESPRTVLRRVWEALDRRYGSPIAISDSLQKRLQAMPTVRPPNLKSKLYDLIHICRLIEANMTSNPELHGFDRSDGQRQVWLKLSDRLQRDGNLGGTPMADRIMRAAPPFVMLVDYLEQAYDELSDPKYDTGEARDVRKTLVTSTFHEERNGPICLYHDKPGHLLVNCKSFAGLTSQEKQKFASQKRLCFKCLGSHLARNCTGSQECSKCIEIISQ